VPVSDLGDDGSLDDAQVGIAKRNFGPCQARYQRRSIDISSYRAAARRISFALWLSRTIASVATGVVPRGLKYPQFQGFSAACYCKGLLSRR
jgi:hypothetical protein